MDKKIFKVCGEYDLGYGNEFIVKANSKDDVKKYIIQALIDVDCDADDIDLYSIKPYDGYDIEI